MKQFLAFMQPPPILKMVALIYLNNVDLVLVKSEVIFTLRLGDEY